MQDLLKECSPLLSLGMSPQPLTMVQSDAGILFFLFLLINLFLFIYFWLRWAFVAARGLSLAATSGDTLRCMCRLLIVVASLVVEHGLQAHGLQ